MKPEVYYKRNSSEVSILDRGVLFVYMLSMALDYPILKMRSLLLQYNNPKTIDFKIAKLKREFCRTLDTMLYGDLNYY